MGIDHGMSIAEVEALGATIRKSADQLAGLTSVIDRLVNSAAWLGSDASRFKSQWWPTHRTKLANISSDLLGFAQSALNNASDQRDASNDKPDAPPTSAPHRMPVLVPGAVASKNEIDDALATLAMPASRQALPGAMSQLDAWAAELRVGEHSEVELRAFMKYREAIMTATVLRVGVQTAAENAIAELRAAGESGAHLVMAALPIPHGTLDTSINALGPAAKEVVGSVTHDAVDGVAEDVGIKAGERSLGLFSSGMMTANAVAVRQAYEVRADAFLSGSYELFHRSDSLVNVDPTLVRINVLNEYDGKLDVAIVRGELPSAFDVGPSYLTSPLSGLMDHLVPKSGTLTFGTLGALETNQHLSSVADYSNLAVDGSMDVLYRSLDAMQL